MLLPIDVLLRSGIIEEHNVDEDKEHGLKWRNGENDLTKEHKADEHEMEKTHKHQALEQHDENHEECEEEEGDQEENFEE